MAGWFGPGEDGCRLLRPYCGAMRMRRVPVADVVLGVCGLAVTGLEASLVTDYGLSWFVVANVAVQFGLSVALVIRRVWRRASFIASYGLLAGLAVLVWAAPVNLGVTPMVVCAPLSLYVVARRERTGWGVAGLLLGVAGAFVSPLHRMPTGSAWWIPLLVITMVGTYLWAAGRRRTELAYQQRLAIEREHHAQLMTARVAQARADERARLARELHDIVAHSLTVVQVQAGTGLAVGTTEQMGEALRSVRDSSGHALTEIRSLVGALRDQDTGPATSGVAGDVTTIPTLIAAAGAAGVVLTADVPGPEVLARWQNCWSAQSRLTALRVVQEALTNVIKHGGTAPRARLRVAEQDGSVVVEVRNDHAGPGSDAGFGLVGLRERVLLAEGTFHAGPDPDGFGLRATIPLAAVAACPAAVAQERA